MMKTPEIFDNAQFVRQRQRAASGFSSADFLKQIAVDRLADRLDLMRRDFQTLLDIGSHGGYVAQALAGHDKLSKIISADPAPAFVERAASYGPSVEMRPEIVPDEVAQVDAIVSLLYLHQVNDLPGFIKQMANKLRPDGLFFAVLFGGRTLQELRACLSAAEEDILGGISPHVAPMADIRDVGGLLGRAGLALPVADSELLTVTYSSAFALMRELRAMGEGNCLIGRRQSFSRRDVFLRAAAIYQERYGREDGTISASFELIHLTAWSPDDSQQKPLRPGSAKVSLTEVL
ncbi:MAG: class I SAM-dependent methyltransferase [Candidatus Puniceispirillaceae bacterium]